MPEVTFPSEWLKANVNVKQGDTIRFIDAGTFDEEKEQTVLMVEIYHDGLLTDTKKFGLNKTNFKVISPLYGTNTDGWVGKEMIVNVIKVRNPQLGVLVDGVALSAPVAK